MQKPPFRGVAQPGSARGLGPRSREFKSHRPDQFIKAGLLSKVS